MDDPNLYDSPKEDATTLDAKPRLSLLHQAPRFSCYAPLVLFLVSSASTWSPFLLGLFYLIDSVSFVLGLVGVIGGIRRGAADIVRLAALGMLLSGFPFAVILLCVLR
jgi:hypothetical protein